MLEGFLLYKHDLSSEHAFEEENKRPKTYKWMPDDCEVQQKKKLWAVWRSQLTIIKLEGQHCEQSFTQVNISYKHVQLGENYPKKKKKREKNSTIIITNEAELFQDCFPISIFVLLC